jgi:hypothetical protein
MNNLNSIPVEDNLVKDPELSSMSKGTAVCKFTVACNRRGKQEDQLQKEASFFDVTAWIRLAEVCGEYLKKDRGDICRRRRPRNPAASTTRATRTSKRCAPLSSPREADGVGETMTTRALEVL